MLIFTPKISKLCYDKPRHGCRGQGTVEMVGGIVVFTVMMAGLISFSLFLYMNHAFLTAVREGARYAATDSRMGTAGTVAAAQTAVKNRVIQIIQASTGLTVAAADITVSAPTGATIGQRNVTVSVQYDYDAPFQLGTLISALGGGASDLDSYPIQAQTVMRYEE
jgi:Flp pilus assembly protein TadG